LSSDKIDWWHRQWQIVTVGNEVLVRVAINAEVTGVTEVVDVAI